MIQKSIAPIPGIILASVHPGCGATFLEHLMTDKNTFLLFKDLLEPVDGLSNEDAGMFIKAILHYQNGGDIPELSPAANVTFVFTKQQLDRSDEYYEMMCERNRINGAKGGRPKKPKKPSGLSGLSEKPNITQTNPDEPRITLPNPNPNPDSDKEEDTLTGRASYVEVIQYLNEKAHTHFSPTSKDTQRKIKARWNAGYCLPDFKKVIDIKVEQWLTNPEMVSYLRPITLFGPKFESYLNERQHEEKQNKPREKKSLGMCPDCKADLYHDPRIEKTEVMCCRCERIYLFDEFGGLERVTEYGEEKT